MKEVIELAERPGAITSPRRLFNSIRRLNIDYAQENLLLFTLDPRKGLIGCHVVFKGGRSCLYVDPATLFRRALLDNASAIIHAHNHPSGQLSPSDEDLAFHDKLTKAGRLLYIDVLDGVVFSEEEYYRMDPKPG